MGTKEEGGTRGGAEEVKKEAGRDCLVLVLLMLDCEALRLASRVNVSKFSTYGDRLI